MSNIRPWMISMIVFSKPRIPVINFAQTKIVFCRRFADNAELKRTQGNTKDSPIVVGNKTFDRDSNTNVTSHILSYVGRNLIHEHNHPLNLITRRIVNHMYGKYVNRRGNPVFSVYDRLSPVVSVEQNFDSLLIPLDHPSRKKTDSYYINSKYLLRPHTSAHQKDLIQSGLNNFLVVGDVYRRDEIDSTHFPVFHQVEGVRLFSPQEVLSSKGETIKLFENDVRKDYKQEGHTVDAVKLLECDLKNCLVGLVQKLFGSDIPYKWTESYFPFTHPSWELEVFHGDKWLEVLGCGIVEQRILHNAGASEKIGWAFGLGLERLAMKLYSIPDIRLFWSKDSGFLSQFDVDDPEKDVTYKEISKYPQCINDISFWVSENFHPNDFFDLARSVGGDIIEQVHLIDEFFHPKRKRKSYCYRIVYRHMERTLTQSEVNKIHAQIERTAAEELCVEVR